MSQADPCCATGHSYSQSSYSALQCSATHQMGQAHATCNPIIRMSASIVELALGSVRVLRFVHSLSRCARHSTLYSCSSSPSSQPSPSHSPSLLLSLFTPTVIHTQRKSFKIVDVLQEAPRITDPISGNVITPFTESSRKAR